MNIQKKISLTLALFCFSPVLIAADELCTLNGSITNAPDGVNYAGADFCLSEPDYYAVTVYELGLCTSVPTAPTAISVGDASNCQIVFRNLSGSTVEVIDGSPTELTGTITRPNNGTYTYAYINMDEKVTVRHITEMSDGNWCATDAGNEIGGVLRDWSSATCGTEAVALAALQDQLVPFHSLPDSSGNDSNIMDGVLESTTGDRLYAYLTDSDGLLSSNQVGTSWTDTDGIFGYQLFANPVTVTDDTSAFKTQFKKTSGLAIEQRNPHVPGEYDFNSAPFSLILTVE
jgi:hypothetical protein